MADATTEVTAGVEVDELVADEQHPDTILPSTGWPCQQRRKGRSAELPVPQRYLDLPIWLSAPARRRDPEEEIV